MDLQTITDLISQVGFPIFVSIYLLVTMKKEMILNREVLLKLEGCICTLTTYIKEGRNGNGR